MVRRIQPFVVVLLMLCFASFSFASDNSSQPDVTADKTEAGLLEKTGEKIPVDIPFVDENGKTVTIAQLLDKPALFVPVYYSCTTVCNVMLASVARVLQDVKLKPGVDYRIISFSFDPSDTPALALDAKKNYLKAVGIPFPEDQWTFLTGKEADIKAVMNATGYSYKKVGKDFLHPVVLFTLAPSGMITRYLYGMQMLPMDVSMSIIEASEGKVGTPIKKFVQFCFSYDPEGKRYVFNVLRVSGITIFTGAFLFLLFLIFGKKRKSKKRNIEGNDGK